MNIDIFLDDQEALKIGRSSDYKLILMDITGRFCIQMGSIKLEDDTEVLFRVIETLAFFINCVNGKDSTYMFRFEPTVTAQVEGGQVNLADYNTGEYIGSVGKEEIQSSIGRIDTWIVEKISMINPELANDLLSRDLIKSSLV